VLDRPLLNSVWQQRILRILDIEDRRYNVYIEPDLLATFSLGPVPNSTVKALVRANKKRESLFQYTSPFYFILFFLTYVSSVCRCEHNEAE
jgi:hypothetical protein